MIHLPALIGVLVVVALAVFFWRRFGTGSGRQFGNRVAAHLGMPRSLFHALLDHGVQGSSRDLLVAVERMHPSLDEASIDLGPTLSRGIERLEAHFGAQESVDAIKPIVARLLAAAGRDQAPRVMR